VSSSRDSDSGNPFIVGAYEHPTRHAPDKTVAQLHVEVARGALDDAGLVMSDVDAYFCADADAPGLGPLGVIEHLGIRPKFVDSTDLGGAAYISHLNHAARAIRAGLCQVALVTMAGKPRTPAPGAVTRSGPVPGAAYEGVYRSSVAGLYAQAAARHMYEFGTTSEHLAWVKVAASHHAQYNPDAFLPKAVTVEDVVNSPLIADPLHRLDCCVITDGGGAVVLASPDAAKDLPRSKVLIRGVGETVRHQYGGYTDITTSGAVISGRAAFDEAGVTPDDIKCACIYDSFTISVIVALEDLGFCEKGKGGRFVSDGNLISGVGTLPFNTDGGGLCNNHPNNRGGMTKIIEAVRQLRGEANPEVQVPNCDLALAHGTGGWLATRSSSATVILERV
jgi:acetyl-CoA C-acetyltransferase